MKLKFVMTLLLIFGMLFLSGCNVGDTITNLTGKKMSEEDALKVLEAAENLHAKVKVSVTTYFIENPGKLSADQIAKIKAANDTFEVAYKTTKKAIADIKYVKNGGKVTFSDISNELMIFIGKYGEFKKAIQPFVEGRVEFPDDALKNNPNALPNATVDDIKPAT